MGVISSQGVGFSLNKKLHIHSEVRFCSKEREPLEQRLTQVSKGYSTIMLYHIQRSPVGFFHLCKSHCKMGNCLVCASHRV
jgi:hypothetical protein